MSTTVSGVGSVNSAGIGSGLDVNSIVTQLMAVEQQPLTQLQSAASDIKSQVSTFGQLQSYFSSLQDKCNALTDVSLWGATTAASADSASVGVSASSYAAVGNYAVSVQRLASSQTVTASALASSSSTLSEGTLTIELGSWTGDAQDPFHAKSGSTPVTIDIGAGQTSLAAIRDKINAANAGVMATIVTDANGARLSLRSKDTGAENAFRITATETADDGNTATGLSALGYDGTVASPMSRSEEALSAQAKINGIAVESASNTLSNVVDGLSISLLKVTSAPVSVSVAADTATIKQKIADFITAYNGLAGYIHNQTAYNADAKIAGALQGDQTVNGLQRALRDVLNQSSSASSAFSRLSDIGITMQASGLLTSDTTKLDSAMSNLPELKKLFSAAGADNASTGFAMRWKKLTDAALGPGGTFETRTSSLNSRLSRNSADQDAMQTRLSQTEARLRAQYTALDTKMATLTSLSNYMTQQLAQYNKTSS